MLDRFAQGLPDPQAQKESPEHPVDECANDECQAWIYSGDKVWRYDGDHYCKFKCLAIAMGAVEIKAGRVGNDDHSVSKTGSQKF
ncbi:hypothetical protein P4V54_09210 [Brevibacillus nitrificans]|uniref:hypothetical protein n=1 Tax=Brevibacillus nitrificans TaxID=651560 RepID=UPI002E1B8452|nr:hypothetical protein [Brevibacillus nitrificans]